MNKLILDVLTGVDNQSFAIIKVIGFAVVFVFMFLEICAFFLGKPFDAQSYGFGSGLVIATMGAAIKITASTEPKP